MTSNLAIYVAADEDGRDKTHVGVPRAEDVERASLDDSVGDDLARLHDAIHLGALCLLKQPIKLSEVSSRQPFDNPSLRLGSVQATGLSAGDGAQGKAQDTAQQTR